MRRNKPEVVGLDGWWIMLEFSYSRSVLLSYVGNVNPPPIRVPRVSVTDL